MPMFDEAQPLMLAAGPQQQSPLQNSPQTIYDQLQRLAQQRAQAGQQVAMPGQPPQPPASNPAGNNLIGALTTWFPPANMSGQLGPTSAVPAVAQSTIGSQGLPMSNTPGPAATGSATPPFPGAASPATQTAAMAGAGAAGAGGPPSPMQRTVRNGPNVNVLDPSGNLQAASGPGWQFSGGNFQMNDPSAFLGQQLNSLATQLRTIMPQGLTQDEAIQLSNRPEAAAALTTQRQNQFQNALADALRGNIQQVGMLGLPGLPGALGTENTKTGSDLLRAGADVLRSVYPTTANAQLNTALTGYLSNNPNATSSDVDRFIGTLRTHGMFGPQGGATGAGGAMAGLGAQQNPQQAAEAAKIEDVHRDLLRTTGANPDRSGNNTRVDPAHANDYLTELITRADINPQNFQQIVNQAVAAVGAPAFDRWQRQIVGYGSNDPTSNAIKRFMDAGQQTGVDFQRRNWLQNALTRIPGYSYMSQIPGSQYLFPGFRGGQ